MSDPSPALQQNGGVQFYCSERRGSGRFPLCHSSADDHISSVVTNVITYGCLWATIHMQGSLQARGGCLSSPAAQFEGFVSLVGV